MTITTSGLVGVIAFSLAFGAVYAAVTLWRRRIPGLDIGRSLRAALYLSRYAAALEYYGLRRREIIAHIDDLRADLTAIDQPDLDATLNRLGPPRTLAAEMTSGLLRPSLLRGAIWFGVAVVFVLVMSLVTTDAFLSAFEALAGSGERATWSFVGLDIEATMGADGHASSIGFGGPLMIFLPLVAFVLGARLWRLADRARHRSSDRAA